MPLDRKACVHAILRVIVKTCAGGVSAVFNQSHVRHLACSARLRAEKLVREQDGKATDTQCSYANAKGRTCKNSV